MRVPASVSMLIGLIGLAGLIGPAGCGAEYFPRQGSGPSGYAAGGDAGVKPGPFDPTAGERPGRRSAGPATAAPPSTADAGARAGTGTGTGTGTGAAATNGSNPQGTGSAIAGSGRTGTAGGAGPQIPGTAGGVATVPTTTGGTFQCGSVVCTRSQFCLVQTNISFELARSPECQIIPANCTSCDCIKPFAACTCGPTSDGGLIVTCP